jgi:hypothetical protein
MTILSEMEICTTLSSFAQRARRGASALEQAEPAVRIHSAMAHPRVDFSQHYSIPYWVEAGFQCLRAQHALPQQRLDDAA